MTDSIYKVGLCQLCGEPMPKGEEMFKLHGYSCDCPKPPLPQQSETDMIKDLKSALERLENAADAYLADQSRATDPRCGKVQPVTVAEAQELYNATLNARKVLKNLT